MAVQTLHILGCRGVPAAHGGFETLAHMLSQYMVENGWRVRVYCQLQGPSTPTIIDDWQGVERVLINEPSNHGLGTIRFDYRAVRHALKEVNSNNDVVLTLGYNTALFSALHRLKGQAQIMNMDGIEWKRQKWNSIEKAFLKLNEKVALKTANAFIADHPEIKRYLTQFTQANTIKVIPYSAHWVEPLKRQSLDVFGIDERPFFSVIARPEPENQILEIVRAFSLKKRDALLVVFGNFEEDNAYHQSVRAAASDEVLFPGAIYDSEIIATFRGHSHAYIHGHTVGGTNPSLVEALSHGNAVIAANNAYNLWTAGSEQWFFNCEQELEQCFTRMLDSSSKDTIARMRKASRTRFEEEFSYERVMADYAALIEQVLQNNH